MKIEKFEEINAWKKSRELVNKIFILINHDKLKKDYSLKDQLWRASISIMNNIAEGFERQSDNEFIKFLYYAKGSSGEVRSLLYVLLDNKYISDLQFKELYKLNLYISNLLGKFISYLNKKGK